MSEALSPDQQRTAELFGTIAVLETLILSLLKAGISKGELDATSVKQLMDSLADKGGIDPDNEWEKHAWAGGSAACTRIKASIRLTEVLEKEAGGPKQHE